jgi:hypothetical protein
MFRPIKPWDRGTKDVGGASDNAVAEIATKKEDDNEVGKGYFVIKTPEIIGGEYVTLAAEFGSSSVPCEVFTIAVAEPLRACTTINNAEKLKDSYVLVERGDCTFFDKVNNVFKAGARGVIVANNERDKLIVMPKGPFNADHLKTTPVVMMKQADALLIRQVAAMTRVTGTLQNPESNKLWYITF